MREFFGQSRSIVAVTTPARSGSVLSMRRSPARRVGKKLNFLDAGSHIVEDADAAFEERYGTWKDRRSTFKKPLFSRRPLGLLWDDRLRSDEFTLLALALAVRRLRVVRHASAKPAHKLCWPVAEHHYGQLESHRGNAVSAGMHLGTSGSRL
jgi:hypothetical protein